MPTRRPEWTVLLLGGTSGVGKTVVAERLGRRLGVSWLQVDDLRLALQYSTVRLPERTADLYVFECTPDVWRLPPETLRDALIAVGEVMTPAIEIVALNHADTAAPAIIEGDGILPALLARPSVRERLRDGRIQAVFLAEPDQATILANVRARGRYDPGRTDAELRTEARAKWLYGRWLAVEAARLGLPVVAARPWETLEERVLAASGAALPPE